MLNLIIMSLQEKFFGERMLEAPVKTFILFEILFAQFEMTHE